MNRNELVNLLTKYSPVETSEIRFSKDFLELLKHPDAYQRYHLPGHLTGSALIVDKSREYILLTHHAKLNKWLQPGGHADGDVNIMRVALREVVEETGITDPKVIYQGLFDIDVHRIPGKKDFPQHDHYDVRFLIEADKTLPLTITEESHDLAWKAVSEVEVITERNESIMRMVRKLNTL
ncbi:MAG: NUDIX hydrolase [Chryseolinea sp.]